MSDILSDLHKPSWWFTAVGVALLVGIVGGVIGTYARGGLDRASSWLSSVRESVRQSVDAAADVVQSDRLLRVELYVRTISYRQQSGRLYLFATMMFVFGGICFRAGDWFAYVSYAACAVFAWSAFRWEALAIEAERITDAVSKRETTTNHDESKTR